MQGSPRGETSTGTPASWALSLVWASGPSGVRAQALTVEGGQGHRRLAAEVIGLIV